jgi:hypothetical protein
MHGPVEVSVIMHVKLPDGRDARLTFAMETGIIPTYTDIRSVVNNCLTTDSIAVNGIHPGTRLMTKPEFVAHITRRETGAAIPLPGDQEFMKSTTDIPRGILIHAVLGRGVPVGMTDDLMARGLIEFDGNQHNESFVFTNAIEKLNDAELLDLYLEINHG